MALAVMACDRAGHSRPPDTAADWEAALRRLAPADEAWCLVAPPDRPAFLQPPVPPEAWAGYKDELSTPDQLDVLVTAKNVDLKRMRMRKATPEQWLYALIAKQTTEGYSGRDNFGIARMNGGFGSRCFLGLAPAEGGLGPAIMRDIRVLLDRREERERGAYDQGIGTRARHALLWCLPWDGTQSLALEDIDPLAIEVCRRIRLVGGGERLAARTATSKVPRIAAKERLGVLQDPWAPVELGEPPKVLTMSGEGFTARRLVDLYFGGGKRSYQLPMLALPHGDEDQQAMRLWAAVLVRGQGKTEGFHTREVTIPPESMARLRTPELAKRAHAQLQDWAEAERILRLALIMLVQKGPEKVDLGKPTNDALITPMLKRFQARMDALFFPALWGTWAEDGEAARTLWIERLDRETREILNEAIDAAPIAVERRAIAAARAHNLLSGLLRGKFPELARTIDDSRDVA